MAFCNPLPGALTDRHSAGLAVVDTSTTHEVWRSRRLGRASLRSAEESAVPDDQVPRAPAPLTSLDIDVDAEDEEARRAAVLRALDDDLAVLTAAEQQRAAEEARLRAEAEAAAEARRLNPPTRRRFFIAFDLPESARQRITEIRLQAQREWEEGEIDYLLNREQKTGCEEEREERGGRLMTWVRVPEDNLWRGTLNFVGWTTHEAIDLIREAMERAVVKVPRFQVAVSNNLMSYYPGRANRTRNLHVKLIPTDGSRMLENLALVLKNEIDQLKKTHIGKSLGLKPKPAPKIKDDAETRRKVRNKLARTPIEYEDGFSSTVTLAHVDYYASSRERLRCFNSTNPARDPEIVPEMTFLLDQITLFEQIVGEDKAPTYVPLTSVPLREGELPEVRVRERRDTARTLDDKDGESTFDDMSKIVEIIDEPNEMEDTLFYKNRLHVNLRIQAENL